MSVLGSLFEDSPSLGDAETPSSLSDDELMMKNQLPVVLILMEFKSVPIYSVTNGGDVNMGNLTTILQLQ
jgi:hypothetical protein